MGRTEVVAFLGETFMEYKSNYYSMPPNSKFLQMTFGDDNVKVISPAECSDTLTFTPNSIVDSLNFYKAPLPSGCTTKEFYKRTIFQKGFYSAFCKYCDLIISDHPNAVFWARTPSPGGIIFAFRVMKAKKKLLHHICGDARDTWRDKKYRGVNKLLAYLFSKVVVKQLKKIIRYELSVNLTSGSRLFDFSSKYSKKTYQFLDVISNGVDNNRLDKKQQDVFNVTFIGRLVEDKGIFELLKAFKKAVDMKNGGYHLTIVGGGGELKKIKTIIKSLALTADVSIKGVLDAKEISEVLSQTDVVVIPSKTNEGFPRVIFEAWSHCIPVIVSNIGGISAFVVNHYNARVVKPGSVDDIYSALVDCLDPKIYSRLQCGAVESKAISTQKYWSQTLKELMEMEFKCEK